MKTLEHIFFNKGDIITRWMLKFAAALFVVEMLAQVAKGVL